MFASRQFSKRRFPTRLASGSVIALNLAWSGPALAYRPFDGTDAAVAAPGEVEIEMQPAGRLREGTTTTLVAPATVLNFGLSEGWEAVFEGQGQTPRPRVRPASRPQEPSSSTSCNPAACRTRPGQVLPQNLACCFPTAPGIQAWARASRASSRSGGTGGRST
jgi:hypothetical protein